MAAVALLAFLALDEAILRYAFRNLATTADGRSFFNHRWRAREVRLNRHGFRDTEFTKKKSEQTYRLAIVGDSITYGQGLAEQERFGNRLAAALAKHHVEVINFGESGADTTDELRMLSETVLPLAPDFILLQWFPNDFEGHVVRDRLPKLTPGWFTRLHARLVAASALYSMSNQFLQQVSGVSTDYPEYMRRTFGNPQSAGSRIAMRRFREFLSTCKSSHVPVGVILFPVIGADLPDQYPFAFLHDRVLTACREEAVICIDLRQSLPANVPPEALWVTRFDPHPGARVNEIAADLLLSTFGTSWRAR